MKDAQKELELLMGQERTEAQREIYTVFMQTNDGRIKGQAYWNPYYLCFQTYIDGVVYEEFKEMEAAKEFLYKAGFPKQGESTYLPE